MSAAIIARNLGKEFLLNVATDLETFDDGLSFDVRAGGPGEAKVAVSIVHLLYEPAWRELDALDDDPEVVGNSGWAATAFGLDSLRGDARLVPFPGHPERRRPSSRPAPNAKESSRPASALAWSRDRARCPGRSSGGQRCG